MYAHKYTVEQFVNAGVTASSSEYDGRWGAARTCTNFRLIELIATRDVFEPTKATPQF